MEIRDMEIVARTMSHRRTVEMTRQGHETLGEFLSMSTDLWNAALQEKRDAYRLAGKSPTAIDQMKSLTEIRADNPEWRKFSVMAERSVLARIGGAYDRFISGTAGMPRFKSKRRGVRSFEVGKGGFTIRECGGARHEIRIKGFKPFRFKGGLPKGEIVMVRILKKSSRVEAILVAKDELRVERSMSPMVGGDLGIVNQLTMSNGLMFRKQERDRGEIKRLQRKVSGRKRGSKSRKKAVDALRRACEREANRLHNKAHRITDFIIRACGPNIAMEKLQIRNMLRNKKGKMSRNISDALWGKILRMLEYKCRWRGGRLTLVDPRNTSKTCNACSAVKDSILLSQRVFECESCGHRAHRDLNAACNVGDRGLDALGAEGITLSGAGGTLPAGFAGIDNSGVKAFIDWESMKAIDLQGSRKDMREALLGHHCI